MQATAASNQKYPDSKLNEFKKIIKDEMEEAKNEAFSIKARLDELEAQADMNGGNSYGEDSKNHQQREWLTRTYERLSEKQHDLELALGRIANKTYGIDQNTGQLISEKRLKALPTATTAI